MYIYTKIEIQTNTPIPITPSPPPPPPIGNTAAHPRTQSTFTQKKTKWRYHIHYLLPQMKRIRLMYATVRGGTVCNWKSNIKHRMECQ